jgi:citrate lyase gamma subunit
VASISIQVEDSANEQFVRQSVKQILKKYGVVQSSIQIEKREFETQLNAIYPNYHTSTRISRASFIPKQNHSHSHHGHSHDKCDEKHGHSHNSSSTVLNMNGSLNSGHF